MTLEQTIEAAVERAVERVLERRGVAAGQGDEPEFVTVANACERTSLSRGLIFKWLAEGKLTRYGKGRATRIKLAELRAAMGRERDAGDVDAQAKALARRGR